MVIGGLSDILVYDDVILSKPIVAYAWLKLERIEFQRLYAVPLGTPHCCFVQKFLCLARQCGIDELPPSEFASQSRWELVKRIDKEIRERCLGKDLDDLFSLVGHSAESWLRL